MALHGVLCDRLLGLWTLLASFNLGTTFVLDNNPPRLINFNGYAPVKERAPIGTVIKTLTATDMDGPKPIYFMIDPHNEAKDLVRLGNVTGDSKTGRSVDIILKVDDLDRDFNRTERKLLFHVHDGVNKVLAHLTLFIEDINDVAPKFRGLPYIATVNEDAPNGTLVFNETETFDPDLGLGGSITYKLEAEDEVSSKYFRVDPYSGFLYVNGALDHKNHEINHLNLTAIDGGGLKSTTDVIITVVNVNE